MAKKKVRRKVSKKKVVRRSSVKKKAVKVKPSKKNKIKRVLRNFVLFLVLGIISFVFLGFSNDEIYINLFSILTMLFGFITLALLIALLVLYLKKNLGK